MMVINDGWSNYNMMPRKFQAIKKWIILGCVILLFLIAFFWLSTHAFLEITPGTDTAGGQKYTLTSQPGQKETSFAASSTVKRLVKKGSYEVLAQNGETSYFTVVKVGGFLGKTTVAAKLEPEKSRKFIGDNPIACMYHIGQVLASGGCGDFYNRLSLHVPATAKQPTYTQPTPSHINGAVEGVITTSQGTIALIRSPSKSNHVGYIVKEDLNLTNPVLMPGLNKDKAYSMQAYKDGFIVFDEQFNEILYYATLGASPSAINIKRPDNKKLKPYQLRARGNSILVAYTDNPVDEEDRGKQSQKINTAITVTQENQTRQYDFKKPVSSFLLCGTSKLCIITGHQLEIHDIRDNKPHLVFSVGDVSNSEVNNIENVNGTLIILKKYGVLGLDVDSRKGSMHYSFGDYSFCRISAATTGYTLCLANNKQKNVALYIDPTAPNTDSIDKKTAQVLKSLDVKNLSIYGNQIFISPNLGDATYDPATKSFGYSASLTKNVNSRINEEINKSKIDRNVYQIHNTFE